MYKITDEEREKIEARWAEIEAEENGVTPEERAQELAYWEEQLKKEQLKKEPPI